MTVVYSEKVGNITAVHIDLAQEGARLPCRSRSLSKGDVIISFNEEDAVVGINVLVHGAADDQATTTSIDPAEMKEAASSLTPDQAQQLRAECEAVMAVLKKIITAL